jgi:hypothetical protein
VILAEKPQALQLRYISALHEIVGEKTSTIVFPLPMEFLRAFTPDTARAQADSGKLETD